MKRNDFGLWGLELSPEEFARALAALGVFEGSGQGLPTSVETIWQQLLSAAAQSEGLLRWSLNPELIEKLAELKKPGSALAFAQAWEKFRGFYTKDLRFELYLGRTQSYFWVAEQLLGSAVRAASLYVRVDEPQTVVGWNWPLRIGFMKDDECLRLRQQLEGALKSSSLKKVVEFVTLESERDDCDLLILPQTLQGALSELLKASWHAKADCVLVLGGTKDLSERMVALLQAVRSQARTSGVGLLSVAEERRGEWLRNLLSGLSQNNALDVALFNANRELNSQNPLLAASRLLIDLSLVSRTAARMGQALERKVAATHAEPPPAGSPGPLPPASPPRKPVGMSKGSSKGGAKGGATRSAPPSGGAVKKNGGGGLSPAARKAALEVAAALTITPPASVGGMFESVEAPITVAAVNVNAMMTNSRKAQSIINKISHQPEERRIQAQVFDSPGGHQQRGALKPASAYAVDVRIGPLDAEWESAQKAFPIDELPPSETGHNLTVIFTEPSVSPDPQVAKLFLPPDGASAPCRFYFHTGDAHDLVRARITVLHRNRVIQTAILNAPVAASGKATKDKLTVEIEARVLPNINDLKHRQTFDAALVLNHAADGQPLLTAVSGEQAAMFSFDATSFKDTIDKMNGLLSKLAHEADDYPEDLSAKETTGLLTLLARHGRMLYFHLFQLRSKGQWLLGKDQKKVQIISTRPESNLPLEFLYEYEAPNEKAKLCAFATKALPTGQCDKACGGPKKKKTVVCPLGFWGLNRVIERHTYDDRVSLQGDTYALMAASTSERQPLHVLDKALFAASARVDAGDNKGTIKSVEKVLKEKTKRADYVMSWKDWAAKIKTQSPTLLILLSHTEVEAQADEMPALEISEKDRLSVIDITEKYVLKRGAKTRPLVMLVGCSTHAPANQLDSFVPFFGRHASIVVSTGATVLAMQAAKVATEFVRALSELSGKSNDITFGDVMLDVRRKLLAKGLPMVLCLEAYGDADWYLK